MGQFLYHGPCEKCGSKDNRAHYSDGSTYCFGCKDYTRPTHPVSYEPEEKEIIDILPHLVDEVPEPNLSWLRKYLTDEQISDYFYYCPKLKRHVYVEYDGEKVAFWEARTVNKNLTKVISSGTKQFKVWGKYKETGVVVFVEDIISAIKLSEIVGVCCLHGSAIPNGMYERVAGMGLDMALIWLDRDKLSDASVYVRKFDFWNVECSLIMTPKDPKDYSKEELVEIIKDAI